jgi:outer membrane scaffolding protein for murein synthesis (MipA/OmpV family)
LQWKHWVITGKSVTIRIDCQYIERALLLAFRVSFRHATMLLSGLIRLGSDGPICNDSSLTNLPLLKKSLRLPVVFAGALLGAGLLVSFLGKAGAPPAEMRALVTNEESGVAPLVEENAREGASNSGDRLPLGQFRPSLRLTPRPAGLAAMNSGQEAPVQFSVPKDGDEVKVTDALRVSSVLANSAGGLLKGAVPAEQPALAAGMDQSPPKSVDPRSETTIALGAGLDRVPRWAGSARSEIRPIPYIDINWHDRVEFSTVKGLIVDLIYGERWHGGLIGTMVWGRSRRELSGIQVPTLKNTIQGGVFLEYALTPELTMGARLRQDIQNTGVSYGEIYAELALPKIGYLEHDIRISQEAMNQKGMRRFFGVTAQDATRSGMTEYNPKAGASRTYLTYEGFQPTSESTGIAFAANVGRLNAGAANSPLVRNFGSRVQTEFVAAFVYHY